MASCPRLTTVLTATACLSACGLATPALAAPDALDYVPAEAVGVVSVSNLDDAVSDLRLFAQAATLPLDGEEVAWLLEAIESPTINAQGSSAVFMLPGEFGPLPVLVLPVTDYGAFVESFGGVGSGVEEIEFNGQTSYVRSAGEGYAALSPDAEVLDGWEPKAGGAARIHESVGARARAAAGDADVVIVGSLTDLADDWRQGYEQGKGMAMFFGGAQAAQAFEAIDPLVGGFLNDMQTGVVALDFEADGVTARLLSRFKEGSRLAGWFDGSSSTGELLGRLPNQPFGLAAAGDLSSPAITTILGALTKAVPEAQQEQMRASMAVLENMSGGAFVMGAPSMQEMSIGAGAFVRSAYYMRSDEPAALREAFATAMRQADGQVQEQQGMTVTTTASYREDAREIGGASVDEWSMASNFQADPEAGQQAMQAAMQAQMAMGMMFGNQGMGGYVAQADGGLVMTLSRNSDMLTRTLASAEAGNGLTANEAIRAISGKLPQNRAFELYIGVDQLLAAGAAFFGEVEPMPPVGIVAASGEDTAEIALHLPPAVIAKGIELSEMFGQMGAAPGMGGNQDDNGGGPAF